VKCKSDVQPDRCCGADDALSVPIFFDHEGVILHHDSQRRMRGESKFTDGWNSKRALVVVSFSDICLRNARDTRSRRRPPRVDGVLQKHHGDSPRSTHGRSPFPRSRTGLSKLVGMGSPDPSADKYSRPNLNFKQASIDSIVLCCITPWQVIILFSVCTDCIYSRIARAGAR
jgi:hypothetical protein